MFFMVPLRRAHLGAVQTMFFFCAYELNLIFEEKKDKNNLSLARKCLPI